MEVLIGALSETSVEGGLRYGERSAHRCFHYHWYLRLKHLKNIIMKIKDYFPTPWRVFSTMTDSIRYRIYKTGRTVVLFQDFLWSATVCQPERHSPKAEGKGREVMYHTWRARAGRCPKVCCLWSVEDQPGRFWKTTGCVPGPHSSVSSRAREQHGQQLLRTTPLPDNHPLYRI